MGRAGVGDDGAADVKKNQLQPHRKKYWRIPPRGNAAFVACMEDVLEVYARPYDPRRPVVCMDETNKQLIGEVREPLPVAPGQPERIEHEYVRNGVAQIFLEVEPLTGRSHRPNGARARIGPAVGVCWSDIRRRAGVLVMDNLTHTGSTRLPPTRPPIGSKFITRRHDWLNIAEIELSTLCGQCLDRRIPSWPRCREIEAWVGDRNQRPFNSRRKMLLKNLYRVNGY